jgi:hypothetical protein
VTAATPTTEHRSALSLQRQGGAVAPATEAQRHDRDTAAHRGDQPSGRRLPTTKEESHHQPPPPYGQGRGATTNGAQRTRGHHHDRQEEPGATPPPALTMERRGGGQERGERLAATILTGRLGCASGGTVRGRGLGGVATARVGPT